MLCRRLELIPDDHGVVDCMAARISLDLESNDIATSSCVNHACDLFELWVTLGDAVITKVFDLFDTITNGESRFFLCLLFRHLL